MNPTAVCLFALLAGAADPPGRWNVIKTDYYQLFHHPDRAADAKKVKGFLDAAIEGLKKEFAGHPVEQLLKVDCKIYLHPKRSDRASEYMAGITTGGEKYFAVIDLLTPSAYDPNYRSNADEPPGDDHFHKLVVHEYSTILLDRLTQSKGGGWTFFAAPRWFVDGYEEYLGLTRSSPRNRKEVLGKYLALHAKDPDRIDFDFGLTVPDAYTDGAVLLVFMHEEFGSAKVQAILTSKERRFGKAVTTSLGVGLDEFRKRWEAWVKKKAG